MDVDWDKIECEKRASPTWRDIFEAKFEGASTQLKDDAGWRSMLAFDEDVIDGLWHKYGTRIKQGDGPLPPDRWLWLFAYLKSPGTWINVAFMWRESCTTFSRVVNDVIEQLQPLLDEVRVKTLFQSLIEDFLTKATFNRSISVNALKTYLQRVRLRI